MTDTVVESGPRVTSSIGYTGKSTKAVGGTTNIYLYEGDRWTESPVVVGTCENALPERPKKTPDRAIIEEVSVPTDVEGKKEDATEDTTKKTDPHSKKCVVGWP